MTSTSGNRAASGINPDSSSSSGLPSLQEEPRFADMPDWVGPAASLTGSAKLLVSVRSASEIHDALAAGVDLVDLKEPRRGALAPADVELWLYAASLWRQRFSPQQQDAEPFQARPPLLSAALGERSEAVPIAARLPEEFAFAKVGPHGCDSRRLVDDLWDDVRQLLDADVELVAVAYADFRSARCVPPEQIFGQAIDAGIQYCLIDTYVKDGVSTVDHLGIDGLRRLSHLAQATGLQWTCAGSIRAEQVSQLWTHGVQPTCFGVRGDVCDRGRTGKLSAGRIKCWKQSLACL